MAHPPCCAGLAVVWPPALRGRHAQPAGMLQATTLQHPAGVMSAVCCEAELESCHLESVGSSHDSRHQYDPPSGGSARQDSSAARSGSAVPNGRLSRSVSVQQRWTSAATVRSAAVAADHAALCSARWSKTACPARACCPRSAPWDCKASAVLPVYSPCASRL